jgi:hypothetical protein
LLLGTTALAYGQRDEQQGDKQKQEQRGDKKDDKKDKASGQGRQGGQDKQSQQAKPDTTAQRRRESKPQQAPQTRAQQQQQPQDKNRQQAGRVPQERQKQLVDQQQQRLTQYRQQLDQQQRVVQQQAAQLQQQKRSAQYRLQQNYVARLGQQRLFLNDHHPDYDRDPFFFTVSIYRYNRGGRYYETNQYGADLLRQAVNSGYEEGFRAGEADRQDHWRFGYEDSYAYQDANFGYNGYYVDRDDYNFYFREGFRRGYEDGFNSRYQYGRYANGSYSMNDSVLTVVLGFQPVR